ncbi:MAG: nicotinamide riboside transporter PnuC [Rickettsiales bacterium]|jgi:nicotinamide mononucleotide transporter|nr:nicotinamide riboside transporter PnuC [Rickettsiales bacterium]
MLMLVDSFVFVTGLLQLYLFSKGKRVAFIINSIFMFANTIINFSLQLYANAIVLSYVTVMSAVGFFKWNKEKEINPKYFNKKELFYFLFICSIFLIISYLILSKFTSSNVPLFDAFATLFAILDIMLITRQNIEVWYIKFVNNMAFVIFYFTVGRYLFSIMNIIQVYLDIAGFLKWKKWNRNN